MSNRAHKLAIPSTLNAIIVFSQLVALAGCFACVAHVTGWSLVALGSFFAIVMNSVYSTIHEAHHRTLFTTRWLNDGVGIFLALFFPAPFHLLRQGHLGHHRRNRSDDEAFDLYFGRDNKAWKFIAWYGILFGLYWVLVACSNIIVLILPWLMRPKLWRWDRTSEVFLSHFAPQTFTVMRLEALAAISLHIAILILLGCPWITYLIMYFCFGWMWSSLQYVHHYQAERDVLDGARDLRTFRLLDAVWLNHNLHKTHHRHPTNSWVHLRDIARHEGTESFSLMAAYLRMWRGPQPAREHIQNQFQGEVTK
jgi:fatty acid desaturase